MPSMLDALNKEVARLQKLSELIAEDPEMEETILKFASEKLAGTPGGLTNGHRKRSHRVETTDQPKSSTLTRAIAFIRRNGPSTRQEILEGAEMAGGSFVHFMKDSEKFQQREDGKWELA
jgi:hypothetical protein